MKNIWITGALCLCFLAGFILTGCEHASTTEKQGKDWDYTVVPTKDCPEELKKQIDQKKINAFQMTYDDGEYRYYAVGYGEQENSGFSIAVLGLYEKGDKLCLETRLNGPGEGEVVSDKPSTPYIVIKTERTDKETEFI